VTLHPIVERYFRETEIQDARKKIRQTHRTGDTSAHANASWLNQLMIQSIFPLFATPTEDAIALDVDHDQSQHPTETSSGLWNTTQENARAYLTNLQRCGTRVLPAHRDPHYMLIAKPIRKVLWHCRLPSKVRAPADDLLPIILLAYTYQQSGHCFTHMPCFTGGPLRVH